MLTEVAANYFRGIEAVGGKLKITNRRLLFVPHFLNVQNDPIEIPMSDILSVTKRNTLGLIPNGLQINMKNFTHHKFVVWNRSKLIRIIESRIQRMEQNSGE